MTADQQSFFPIPPIVRRVFDTFPLLTYPPAALPASSPQPQPLPTLYVFSTPEDATAGRPSFNPDCLKWQTYLKLCRVQYRNVASNNHASPSGALPFLLPAAAGTAVQVSRLPQWATENGHVPLGCNFDDPEVQAFLSLVNTKVRDVWLYALYIEPHNFSTLAIPLYRSTSNSLVNLFLSSEMQKSAIAELTKCRSIISGDDIYADADAALTALATVLGGDRWFFGAREPGLFDASVFGYTHLALSLEWSKKEATLVRLVWKHENLVGHERRVSTQCGW